MEFGQDQFVYLFSKQFDFWFNCVVTVRKEGQNLFIYALLQEEGFRIREPI